MGWIGCGGSALLLGVTIVFWVRSLGYWEQWYFHRFEPNPKWRLFGAAGLGTHHERSVWLVHGRLWLGSATWAPVPGGGSQKHYMRWTITAEQAKEQFDWQFQPGARPYYLNFVRGWRFAGTGFSHWRNAICRETGRPRGEFFQVAMPCWMLAILFGLWPGIVLTRRILRRQRYGAGLCQHCGYDLRATPDRCPECGREAAALPK